MIPARYISLLSVLLLAGESLGTPPLQLTSTEQAVLRGHPVWRLAGGAKPPFQWIDNKGHFQGMAEDYRQLIQLRASIRLDPVGAESWSQSLEQLRRHDCDVVLLITQTADRDAYLLFTDPVLTLPGAIITRSDNKAIKAISDLAGREVVVARNRAIHEKLAREHPEMVLEPRDDIASALSAVALGDADAFVGDLFSATEAIDRLGLRNLKIPGDSPYTDPFRISVRNDWPEAISILNKAIATISPQEQLQGRTAMLAG